LATSSAASTTQSAGVWERLTAEAAAESPLWGGSLRPIDGQDRAPVFSLLCEPRFALGVETIYEGYLLHYGRPRLFSPADADTALLLGDYLYAHGLVRVAATGSVEAVHDLAELISLCAQARADGRDGEAAAWAATSALLGQGALAHARQELSEHGIVAPLMTLARTAAGAEAVAAACVAHDLRVG
jgi:hypothetical protein